MMEHDDEPEVAGSLAPGRDEIDREIDTALARCVAVEPRAGLSERVLANLRAEQQRAAQGAWWRWPAAAALAAVLIVAALFAVWRPGKPSHGFAVHSSATAPNIPRPDMQAANHGASGSRAHGPGSERRPKPRIGRQPARIVASAPKLEQFPSPQPLSTQEKILASYVANYPEHAALIAQARAEALRRDATEELNDRAAMNEKDSQQ